MVQPNNIALTVQNCYKQILHALHGAEPVSRTKMEILNETGSLLYTMHRWKFLDSSPATLSLVANQNYLELPQDYAGMVTEPHPTSSSTFWSSLSMVAPDEVIQNTGWNTTATGTQAQYFGTVMFAPGGLTGAPPEPRLYISPTTDTDQTDAWSFSYKRQWTDLYEDTQQISIPGYCRSLFLDLLSAVALGKEEDSAATVDDRVAKMLVGSLFNIATHQDALVQLNKGPTRNAPMQMGTRYYPYFVNGPMTVAP